MPHIGPVVLVTGMNDPALVSAVMLIQLLFLFCVTESKSINISSALYVDLPKCCNVDSAFAQLNDSFFCNKSENGRVLIQTDVAPSLNNTDGYKCVEAINLDLFLFNRTLKETAVVKNISDKLLPKCCPLRYIYDPVKHSCVENLRNGNINGTFLRVGLPKCDVIYDIKYRDVQEIQIIDNFFVSKWGERFSNDFYCMDETVDSTYVVRVCANYDICNSTMCFRKCCPDGQSFVNGSHCKDTYVYGMDLSRFSNIIANFSADYALIHGYKTQVYPPSIKNYHIDDQGIFYSFEDKFGKGVYLPEEETYCIEHATKNNIVYGYTLFRIFPLIEYSNIENKFLFNRWAMVISNIFLVITILYYVLSKETRKIFGKTLVSFCIALFTLFGVLIYSTYHPNLNTTEITTCKTIGFLIIYLSVTCFMWLQVMCYDICWTLGSSKRYTSVGNKNKRDIKRFICYSLYGWGVPLLVTFILVTLHFLDILPPSIKIEMAINKCLIERGKDNYAEILFYIIPLTLIQSVNVIFFIKTVRYCLQVKGNIQKMNETADIQKKKDKFRGKKERFGLVIKLSLIMGVFYLFEVVSSFYDFNKNVITEHVEIVWDFINCLQGLFIFIIFICKTKYLKKCTRKAAVEKIRKISLTTVSTRTTGLSSQRKSSRDIKRKCSKDEANNKFS